MMQMKIKPRKALKRWPRQPNIVTTPLLFGLFPILVVEALQSLFVLCVSFGLYLLFPNFLGVVAIWVVGVPVAREAKQDDCENYDDNKDYIADELPDAFKNAADEIKHRLPPQSIYRQKGNQCKTIFLKKTKK